MQYYEKQEIPIWEKYALSIKEAAAYFRIGENKLRQIANSDDQCAGCIIYNNNRMLIKREKFEAYLDERSNI